MRTLVSDPPPPEFEALLERRRRSGADRFDEVWEGVLHLMPAPGAAHRRIDRRLAELLRPLAADAGLVSDGEFNLGSQEDYRIPDRGLYRPEDEADWQKTASLVVEIVSPGDESWEKLSFHAAHEVDELVFIDPQKRTVHWLVLDDGGYREVEGSRVITLARADLREQLGWPPAAEGP